MPKTITITPKWEHTFQQAGFLSFDDWWKAEGSLVEEGNFRGADADTSWSHVTRIELPGGKIVYLKRQQNHHPNNTLLKFLQRNTFEIEWSNYQRLQAAGVPTMEIVYFATRKQQGNKQSIIVSDELKGMTPIRTLINYYIEHGWPPRSQRLAMLGAIAKVIIKMHSAGIIHNALYGRHIYLNVPMIDGRPDIPESYHACLIDLERTKFPGKNSPKLITHDLGKMYRRIPEWPARDCLWFLKQYLGIKKLTPEAKDIAREFSSTRIPGKKNKG